MEPIGKDTVGAYYYESEDFSEAMHWSAMRDMLVLGAEEEMFRVYDRNTYRDYFERIKHDVCCLCGERTLETKKITIMIMVDKDGGKETKVGNALFCHTHFKKIMAAAMRDKLGDVD